MIVDETGEGTMFYSWMGIGRDLIEALLSDVA